MQYPKRHEIMKDNSSRPGYRPEGTQREKPSLVWVSAASGANPPGVLMYTLGVKRNDTQKSTHDGQNA